jgi:cytochrome c553
MQVKSLSFLLLCLVSLPVAAQELSQELVDKVHARLAEVDQSEAAWEEARMVGEERAFFCSVCHGVDGNGKPGIQKQKKEPVPKVAAQNPVYLLEQFEKFGDGRRKNNVMQDLAKNFSEKDKIDLVVFYARMSRTQGAGDPELNARGKQVYFKRCQNCHGADGMGGEGYANVASQYAYFVEKTLRDFRDGTGDRDNAMMASMTKNLSDEDIRAVSAYIESMPPRTFNLGE